MSENDWTAIATCVIAVAAIANVLVYYGMWKQTGDLFRESHRPQLTVLINKCEYSLSEKCLKGRIVTTNHGTAVANNVNLRLSFGGSNFVKDINRVAIQPQSKLVYTFALPITVEAMRVAHTNGNRIGALVEGSYKGVADRDYPYRERQEFDPDINRFVPIWAE